MYEYPKRTGPGQQPGAQGMQTERMNQMIASMTGYGRAEAVAGGRSIAVEIRSVNSRYFEYSSRLPRGCAFLDDKLKKQLSAAISRGKVELNLTLQTLEAADTVVEVNEALAASYRQALAKISETLELPLGATAADIARFPDVLCVRRAQLDEEQLWQDVQAVCAAALDNFLSMRRVEGERLRQDVLGRLETIETLTGEIEQRSAGRVQAYTDKLYARLQELLGDRSIEESRLVTEAAIFADKTAIDEETVRLRSHIAQYREILGLSQAVGRKLDFLTQELNREANTIGSKAQDLDITRRVVDIKAEIEKIREQIQNIE